MLLLLGASGPRSATSQSRAGTISPQNLTCESRQNPIGIDTATPHFGWTLRLDSSGKRDTKQSAYRILAASSPKLLARGQGDIWDSGKVPSPHLFGITYAGKPLSSRTRYYWKVRVWDGADQTSSWSEPAQYTTALLHPEEWTAHWIAAEPDPPSQSQAREGVGEVKADSKPLPIFRRAFQVSKPVTQALLFVSGLGQYEARINGQNITDAVLTPGWTDYRKQILYNSYDVTKLLHSGVNAVGVMLGNGMYNVEGIKGRYTKFIGSVGQPKLILQLHLLFADGSQKVIGSDQTWRTTSGPIVFSSIYGGEDYDARREQTGWDTAGFNDGSWSPALEINGPGGKLVAEQIPPVKPAHTYTPVKIMEPKPGVSVYDLRQNFAGWPDITVSGAKGSSVKLIAGELLDANGFVTQRSAHAFPDSENSFTYTLKGSGLERWHPRFTYYGFRYVQTERRGSPVVHAVTGQFLHDEVAVTGNFSSSDELFGKIHHLIDTAVLSNLFSVLTDCPHREKLGWLEQTHLAGASIMYNFDVSRLYGKMSDDMQDSQTPDGMVPAIAPEYVAFVDKNGRSTSFRDTPEWGSAVILSPWTAYQFYGNLEVLRMHYPSMKRYAGYLRSRSKDGMLAYGLGDWYDIGPKPPGESQLTGKGLTATAIYYQDLTILLKIAGLLNQPDDANAYSAEATAVKRSFNAHLFHPETNNYDRGSQTANAMPLVLNLVPEGKEEEVLANLVNDIRTHANHVTAGDIGFHYVVRALTERGRSDVLYDMLSRRDTPSYGYQLSRGATALTEAWDANPDSSQNHFMLGHAEEWFYRGLAGIDFDLTRPTDERIRIRPAPVGDIRTASASFQSVLGMVESRWSRRGNTLQLDVTVPPGATATVTFPTSYARSVAESGKPLTGGNGVHSVHHGEQSLDCVVGSGTYHFTAQ